MGEPAAAATELPTTMRAAVLRGVGEVVVESRPVPAPGAGEVLVRVSAVGVCGSDTHYLEHGRIGPHVVREPMVLGHESSGVVVAVGAGVDEARVGQRISIEPGTPCFVCEMCVSGRYNLCPRMSFHATPPVDGAMSDYVVVHEAMAHPVPDSVSDVSAAMLEPLSVGIWACRRGEVRLGQRVLVTGAGPVGVLAAQVARAMGADVVVSDPSEARRAVAEGVGLAVIASLESVDPPSSDDPHPSGRGITGRLDATQIPRTGEGGEGGPVASPFDVLLECSGHPTAVAAGIAALAPAGRAVLVGMGSDEVSIPMSALQDREITVTGTFRYAGTWPLAIDLAARGLVVLDGLPVEVFDLDGAQDALTAGRRDPSLVKAIVRPGGAA